MAVLPRGHRLHRQVLRLAVVPEHERAHRLHDDRVPAVHRQPDGGGSPRVRLELEVGGRDVPRLVQIEEPIPLHLEHRLAFLETVRHGGCLGHDREPVLHRARPPEHEVPRDERGHERIRIADPAGHLDRLAAEVLTPRLLAHEVDGHREAREQHGAQRAVTALELGEHLLEHGDQRRVRRSALRARPP